MNGGIAILDSKDRVTLLEMPKTEEELRDLLRVIGAYKGRQSAYIEWITPAIWGINKAAAAKIYASYMVLRMCLLFSNIPFQSIKAVKWQPSLGILKRAKKESTNDWKKRLMRKAQKLYPHKKVTLKTSDALLIAHCCKLGVLDE